MAHYLVTGGAGFIGSHLTEELVRRGHRVRVADSLITGKRSNLSHIPDVEFMEGDLANLEFARRAVAGCEYVLHQAAIPSVPRSVKDPISSNRANVDATLNTLVASRDAGVKRLVFAASSSAYGETPTLPKHEEMPTQPLSPYALQKVIGEQYLQLFTRLYGLETVAIRTSTCSGPGRIRPLRTPASSRCLRRHSSRTALRRSTATASRRGISRTWRTLSMASSAPARRRARRGKSSTWPRADAFR